MNGSGLWGGLSGDDGQLSKVMAPLRARTEALKNPAGSLVQGATLGTSHGRLPPDRR